VDLLKINFEKTDNKNCISDCLNCAKFYQRIQEILFIGIPDSNRSFYFENDL